MAWIESHQSLRDHKKVRRLAKALGINRPAAIGHLHFLWWWCLDNAPDGDVTDMECEEFAEAAAYKGDPEAFTAALIEERWVDLMPDGRRLIHDWYDYAGKIIEARKHDTEMKRRNRALYDDMGLTRAVRERDGDRCRYCGKSVNWQDRRGRLGGTYDHVDPSGGNHFDNVVVACRACNAGKNNRTPDQAGYRLIPIGVPTNHGRTPVENLPENLPKTHHNQTVPNRTQPNTPQTPQGDFGGDDQSNETNPDNPQLITDKLLAVGCPLGGLDPKVTALAKGRSFMARKPGTMTNDDWREWVCKAIDEVGPRPDWETKVNMALKESRTVGQYVGAAKPAKTDPANAPRKSTLTASQRFTMITRQPSDYTEDQIRTAAMAAKAESPDLAETVDEWVTELIKVASDAT